MPDELKPLLDTSIVRGLLGGTQRYREFLLAELGDKLYIDRFIDMETKRGLLLPLIELLNTIALPHIHTIGDAEKVWAHSFKTRQIKLVLQLSSDIFDKHRVDRMSPRDKKRGLLALATAIKGYDRKLRRSFTDASHDRTHCSRGTPPLKACSVSPTKAQSDLNAYWDHFQDVKARRQECRIDRFAQHYDAQLNSCIAHADQLPKQKQHERTKNIAGALRKMRSDVKDHGCKECDQVGDVIISVGANRAMRVHSCDGVFPLWCGAIGQPHRAVDAELTYMNKLKEKPDEGSGS